MNDIDFSQHIGRSWSGTSIEDACPCPKAPCGLVIADRRDPECPMHALGKTIRQGHSAGHCPGRQHWAIRLRKKLLRPGSHRTNGWVRGATAWLEAHA